MKAKGVGGTLQHRNGHKTTKHEIAEFFDTVAAAGVQDRLRTVSGTCRFDVTGAGTYRVDVKDGVPAVTHDDTDTAPADCVVALSADDFMRVVRREGHLDTLAALLQGRIAVTGDIALAGALLFSYTPKPVDVQAR
jgi:putative sterol carrier protein